MATQVSPGDILREDEANGGLIKNGLPDRPMRKKGRLAGGVRNKIVMGHMKAKMAALWCDGATYKEIAEQVSDEFGLEEDVRLSSHTIHYHIKQMLTYWRDKAAAHIDERQAMILARYDQIEALATEAYFSSMQGKKTTGYEKQIERARSKEREKAILKDFNEERERIKKLNKRRVRKGLKKLPMPDYSQGELLDTLHTTSEKVKEIFKEEEVLAGDPRFLAIMVDINYKRSQLWGLLVKDTELDKKGLAGLSDEERVKRMAIILQAAKERGQATNLAPPSPMGGFDDGEEPAEVTEIIAEQTQEDRASVLGITSIDDDDDNEDWGI